MVAGSHELLLGTTMGNRTNNSFKVSILITRVSVLALCASESLKKRKKKKKRSNKNKRNAL